MHRCSLKSHRHNTLYTLAAPLQRLLLAQTAFYSPCSPLECTHTLAAHPPLLCPKRLGTCLDKWQITLAAQQPLLHSSHSASSLGHISITFCSSLRSPVFRKHFNGCQAKSLLNTLNVPHQLVARTQSAYR